jgi:cbb3-type cytochrome oxidase subunit 3
MTLAYIIFAIVLLHVLVGFAWVIYKFSKKPKAKKEERKMSDDSTAR